MDLVALCWSGSGLTCTGDPSTFDVAYTGPPNVAHMWRSTGVGVRLNPVYSVYC